MGRSLPPVRCGCVGTTQLEASDHTTIHLVQWSNGYSYRNFDGEAWVRFPLSSGFLAFFQIE